MVSEEKIFKEKMRREFLKGEKIKEIKDLLNDFEIDDDKDVIEWSRCLLQEIKERVLYE